MKSILMKLFIIGLCVSFFPIQAIAGGFTGAVKIKELYQRQCTEGRGFEIILDQGANLNPDGCTKPYILEVRCNTRAYKSAVAISLTAFTGDYYVDAYVAGCDGDGHPIVRALKMMKTLPTP